MKTGRFAWILLTAVLLGAIAWKRGPRPFPRGGAGTAQASPKEGFLPEPLQGNDGGEAACGTEKIRINLASPEVARNVGVATVEVQARPLEETVTANGRVAFDAIRTARIAPRIPGVIREVLKGLGEDVAAGEPLFVIDSVELGEAQSEHLQAEAMAALALQNAARERALAERNATSERELQAAQAEQEAAQARLSRTADRLRNLGLSAEEIGRLGRDRRVSSILTVSAPLAGTVVERTGAVGEMADPSRPLLTVTDLSRAWVLLDLFELQIAKVEVGQKAVFTADAYPDRPFPGTLVWISAQVDPETRTLPARMEIRNAGRLLKANLFGRAVITVRSEEAALSVPREAVQWEGCHHVVFVPVGEAAYQTRKVELGCERGDDYEITAGLLPGERVVTTGSFLMKTEILKGSIGAG